MHNVDINITHYCCKFNIYIHYFNLDKIVMSLAFNTANLEQFKNLTFHKH